MNMPETVVDDTSALAAQHALQIAFQTMRERCQQLQSRLSIVEEENMRLRIERSHDNSDKFMKKNADDGASFESNLQIKVEELSKQKSQLTHHVFMVAAENRQLWNRLTRLTRTNKNLGNQLIKISDTLKQHPTSQPLDALTNSFKGDTEQIATNGPGELAETGDREPSLEEISLRLINSIMMEKSELEQQCTEMVEMQNGADINLQNVGFTYPEDTSTDSLQQLKQHDGRLLQAKETLANQQLRLKRVVRNLKKIKRGTLCKNCRQNASKTMCQIGTQFDSDDSLKEHGATQTSLPPSTSPIMENGLNDNSIYTDNVPTAGQNICPLCGAYFGKAIPFEVFHEHVINHFAKDKSLENFEIVQ